MRETEAWSHMSKVNSAHEHLPAFWLQGLCSNLCSLPSVPNTGVRKGGAKACLCDLGREEGQLATEAKSSHKTSCGKLSHAGGWGVGKGSKGARFWFCHLPAPWLTLSVSLIPHKMRWVSPTFQARWEDQERKSMEELFVNSEFCRCFMLRVWAEHMPCQRLGLITSVVAALNKR